MMDMSRPPPPRVPPVTHEGVRYEQVKDATRLGLSQVTGHLAAYDEASGERLWVLKVYDHRPSEALESDVQEVYFKSLELRPGGRELVVTNEAGARFVVDLRARTVAPLP